MGGAEDEEAIYRPLRPVRQGNIIRAEDVADEAFSPWGYLSACNTE